MKVQLRPSSFVPGMWQLTYTKDGIPHLDTFSELEQAKQRACQLEGIPYRGLATRMEPLDAIRAALEWLDRNAASNARAVLIAALEADANRSHPELPTPF